MNIFRGSRSQMFFKIGALQISQYPELIKSLQHRCFPVNIAKVLRTTFLKNSGGCFYIILKVIK